MENININELFENALKDPSLLSTLDLDKILESIENDNNDYLQHKSMKTITNDIYNTINELTLLPSTKFDYCKKLVGYRIVEDIHELHKGKHIRWISNTKLNLTTGGIVVDIKFLDNGTQVLCKNNMNRFIQIKMDDCILFQKMSLEEQFITMAYDYLDK
jgi:hypothetical protein